MVDARQAQHVPERAIFAGQQRIFRMLLVNVGCGQRSDSEWINLDGDSVSAGIRRYDCREKLPLLDASVDAIYSSHVIEYLPPAVARGFVREVFRVLKSGGVLRLATLDLEVLAFECLKNLYRACDGDLEARNRHEWLVIEIFDQFSRDTPGGVMLEYWKQNPIPCGDYVLDDGSIRKPDSFFIEGVKLK